MGDGPDGTLVETVSRLKFYPVRHRVANVAIAGAWRMVAGPWYNDIALSPKSVGHRALPPNLVCHMVRSGRRCGAGFPDRGRGGKEGKSIFHPSITATLS